MNPTDSFIQSTNLVGQGGASEIVTESVTNVVQMNPSVQQEQSEKNVDGLAYEEQQLSAPTNQIQQGMIGAFPSSLGHIEVKLFVGRLPTTSTEETVRPLFLEFGAVVEVAIIRDKATSAHKGSAFVRMASITQADAAIRSLHNVKILDSSLGPLQISYATGEAERLGFTPGSVIPGEDEVKLFVGSLPRDVSEQDVESFFSKYGKAYGAYLMRDPLTRKFKGCGFVKFAFKEEALLTIKQLHNVVTFLGASRPLEVRIAEPKRPFTGSSGKPTTQIQVQQRQGQQGQRNTYVQQQLPSNSNPRCAGPWKEYFAVDGRPYYHNDQLRITQWEVPPEFSQIQPRDSGDVTGPPGANIFIFHVPNEWGKEDLAAHFARFGYILSAKVAVDHTTNRNKGYGFVSYDNVRSALQAVQQMNLMAAKNKRLRVAIKNGEEEAARLYAEQHGLAYFMTGHQSAPTNTIMPSAMAGATAAMYQQQLRVGNLGAALAQQQPNRSALNLSATGQMLLPNTQGLAALSANDFTRANLGGFNAAAFVGHYGTPAASIPRYGQY